MKITTWNVNGLRAWLGKGSWEWIQAHSPDVFCLQEVKARPEQLTGKQHETFAEVGYQAAWNPAQRAGYSGVLTLARSQPTQISLGLDLPRFDVEGRVVQSEFEDFVLLNVYFPSGQRDYGRVQYKLDFYGALLERCNELHKAGKQLVICGDFNTAHQEIDLRNHRQNHKTSGFLPEEREWVSKYLDHGFVDAFRQLYPEKEQYTWWTYTSNARARNVGWRLDYFLVSEGLVGRVKDVAIHDEVPGSDHCPVTLELESG
jgi:exodeoxyribonuclease-3